MNTLDLGNRMPKLPSFPIVLAIDPSMNTLGWAAYNLNLGQNRYDIDSDAWRFGLVRPQARTLDFPQFNWEDAFYKLRRGLGDWQPTHFASEWPDFFNSTKGKIAATQGYTINLAGQVGYIAGRLGLPPDYMTLWKPYKWKGSVPKSVTQEKFIRLFGEGAKSIVRNYSDDVIDAIMIAEFWLTLYHREKFPWIKRWKANANI